MKKTFLLLFLTLNLSLFSQSDIDKAKAYYFQAETQFEDGNSKKALEYLDRAETLLGDTNGSIEALRVKVYFKTKQYDKAQVSLAKFYEFADSAPSDLQKEMSGFLVKIEDAVKQKKLDIEKRKLEKRALIINREQELLKEFNGRNPTKLVQLYNEGFGIQYLLMASLEYAKGYYSSLHKGPENKYARDKAKELYFKFLSHFKEPKWYNNLDDYPQFKKINRGQ